MKMSQQMHILMFILMPLFPQKMSVQNKHHLCNWEALDLYCLSILPSLRRESLY